jgi:protein-tyrosine-phosphatase
VKPSVVLLCKANLCRSPVAAAMLEQHLGARGASCSVASAGLEVLPGQSAPDTFFDAARARGIDLRDHRPRALPADAADEFDLFLPMTRGLLRTLVVALPSAWPRSFTLLEMVRRSDAASQTPSGSTLREWLEQAHAGRTRSELLGADPLDDIRDPMDEDPEPYDVLFDRLDEATARLAAQLAELQP